VVGWMRVVGQEAQKKGLGETGPAYTAMQQQKRAEDLAMEKRQNELLTAIEGRDYEGAKELFGARDKSMTAANKSFQDRLMTNTKTLADLAGVDQRRMDEALNRLSQEKLERLRIAARAAEANRPGEAERIEARYMGMVAKGQTKEAEEYLERISKIKGSGSTGVGAARNAISERRLEMAGLEKIMKDEAMSYSEQENKQAASEYKRLALMNSKESGGDSSGVIDKANPLLK